AAVEEAEMQAAVGEADAAQAYCRVAADELHVGMVFERRKIDAELERVVQLYANDHRLDGDLPRLGIDLGKDLIDLPQNGFIVAYDHRIDAGKAVAARLRLVGRNIDLRRRVDGDFAVGRKERR